MKLGIFLALMIGLMSIGFSENITIIPTNDTFVCSGCVATGFNTSSDANHADDLFVVVDNGAIGSQSDATADNLQAFFKVNASQYNNRLIRNIFFTGRTTLNLVCTDVTTGNQIIKWFNNNTWLDNMSFAQRPTFTQRNNVSTIAVTANQTVTSAAFNLTQAQTMSSFYNDTSVSFMINAFAGRCNGLNSYASIDSIESSNQPFFTYDLVDFLTGHVVGTDVSTVFFDFQSGTASATSFPQADFSYNAVTNVLSPILPGSFLTTQFTDENSLSTINCPQAAPFSSSTFSNINIPSGDFDVFCFNMSTAHAGNQFYGAIKVINNTNVRGGASPEFDFYYALYSSEFSAFSPFTISPSPAQRARNVTISWTTTQPLTSILKFRFIDPVTNQFTAFGTVSNTSGFRTSHSLVINNEFMTGNFYEIFAQGTTAGGATFTSTTANFSTIEFQQQLAEIATGINIIVIDERGVPLRASVSIDSVGTISTAKINTNATEVGFAQVASFFGFPNGAHNISVVAEGKSTQSLVINVSSQPFFHTVKMRPSTTCIKLGEFQTNITCVNSAASTIAGVPALNVTSFYCSFNPGLCFLFDVNGNCVQQNKGGWEFNACIDGFHPVGFPVNGSVPIGAVQGGQQGVIPNLSDPLSAIFGVSAQQGLSFLALLISIIVTIGTAIKTRDGLISGIVMLSLIFMFTMIGWLPLFVFIIMGILVAFLIAKFFRQGMAGI